MLLLSEGEEPEPSERRRRGGGPGSAVTGPLARGLRRLLAVAQSRAPDVFAERWQMKEGEGEEFSHAAQ